MCGFVSIIFKDSVSYFDNNIIQTMNEALIHRGPDDEGYISISKNNIIESFFGNQSTVKKTVHINSAKFENIESIWGFRRLSILDLSENGHQPMEYLNRYWIMFNGEIYNYLELREELKKYKYKFKSNSDTEVILAAYDFWNFQCFSKFNGMWSFIIYDRLKKEFIISNDRYGIKPLYYYEDSQIIIFSSEIKSILRYHEFKKEINYNYISLFLSEGNKEYLKETAFQNIHRFPNASYVVITKENSKYKMLDFKKYYELKLNNSIEKFNLNNFYKLSEELLYLIEDSVRLRMQSDVEYGATLSGGLDSSTIVYFMKNINSGKKFKTFSIVFTSNETKNCDESYYIDLLSKNLDLNSYKIEPDYNDVLKEYRRMIYVMDTPSVSSLMSYMFTYKLAADNNVKVTLDGQGPDELFGGYYLHLINFICNLPTKEILNNFKSLNRLKKTEKIILLGLFFNFVKKISLEKIIIKLLTKFNIFNNPFLTFQERIFIDFNNHIKNFFHYGDRASMNFGIENRFPYLDYRIVDFAWKISETYKIRNGFTKFILRESMKNKLPNDVIFRKDKMGWEIPEDIWFNKYLYKWNNEIIKDSPFLKELGLNSDPKFTRERIKRVNLALWYDIFFSQ